MLQVPSRLLRRLRTSGHGDPSTSRQGSCSLAPESVSMCAVQAEGTAWGDRKLVPKSSAPAAGCCPPPGHCAPSAPSVSRAVRGGCGRRAIASSCLPALQSFQSVVSCGRAGRAPLPLTGRPPPLLSLPSVLTTGLASPEEQKVDWLPQSGMQQAWELKLAPGP